MVTRGGRRRRWGISSGTSLVTHLMFGAAASLLTSARFEPANTNGDRPSDERESIPIDLVPLAEAAPEAPAPPAAPLPTPPAARPRRATVVEVQPPSAPPREEELVDIAEVDSGEGGTLASGGTLYRTIGLGAPPHVRPAVATAPGEQPPAITASEAAYLRTYETFPNLPASLWVAGRSYIVTAQICVSAEGRVTGVAIKDGGARDLEQVITTSVRSWRYEPRFIGGQPRPFCHLIRFVYSVKR